MFNTCSSSSTVMEDGKMEGNHFYHFSLRDSGHFKLLIITVGSWFWLPSDSNLVVEERSRKIQKNNCFYAVCFNFLRPMLFSQFFNIFFKELHSFLERNCLRKTVSSLWLHPPHIGLDNPPTTNNSPSAYLYHQILSTILNRLILAFRK